MRDLCPYIIIDMYILRRLVGALTAILSLLTIRASVAAPTIPSVCHSACNAAYQEGKNTSNQTRLCVADSVFAKDFSLCNNCLIQMNSQNETTKSDIALQPFIEYCASLNTTDEAERNQVSSQIAQASYISSIQSTATAMLSFETRVSSAVTTPTSSMTTAIVILTQTTRPINASTNTTSEDSMNSEAAVWHPAPGGINWLIGIIISLATFILIPLWILSGKILDQRRQRKARNAANAMPEVEVSSPTAPDRDEDKAQLPSDAVAKHEMPLNPRPTPELLGVEKDKEQYELHSQEILEIEAVERARELPDIEPVGIELPVFDEHHCVTISEFYRVLR